MSGFLFNRNHIMKPLFRINSPRLIHRWIDLEQVSRISCYLNSYFLNYVSFQRYWTINMNELGYAVEGYINKGNTKETRKMDRKGSETICSIVLILSDTDLQEIISTISTHCPIRSVKNNLRKWWKEYNNVCKVRIEKRYAEAYHK